MWAEIVAIEKVALDLRKFWFRLERPLENFVPGRYCTLEIGGIKRPYSIASISRDGLRIELFIEIVPEGALTSRLVRLNVGDQVGIFPKAKGIFTLDPNFKNHIMVATVTGISPFVSILTDRLLRPYDKNRFVVFYGASYQDELAYDEKLRDLAKRYSSRMRYVATVSRPNEARNSSWDHSPQNGREIGRVNNVMAGYFKGCEFSFDVDDSLVFNCHDAILYVCGHPGMMEGVKQVHAPMGWDIKEEAFWRVPQNKK